MARRVRGVTETQFLDILNGQRVEVRQRLARQNELVESLKLVDILIS